MAEELALLLLYDDVAARFAAEAPTIQCSFGWREPTKQINQGAGGAARVVFEPGVERKAGKYTGARRPGRNPRPLRTMLESCTVRCWAFDASAPNDERAQYRAARLLHDATVRAIELSMRSKALANLNPEPFTDPKWVGDGVERQFGAELQFTLQLESIVPDTPYDERDQVQAGIGTFLNDEQDSTDLITGDPP